MQPVVTNLLVCLSRYLVHAKTAELFVNPVGSMDSCWPKNHVHQKLMVVKIHPWEWALLNSDGMSAHL